MGFLNAIPGAVAQGLIWGLFAIGLYISYKILDIADLTVDGSICTGACVLAILLSKGVNVYLCLIAAFAALKERILDASNLPQFLESITFQRNGDVSTLSAPHGTVSMARI